MPVQVSYPGVYIQEVSSGSRTITGVSTSVALFIGMTEQGPLDTPVRVFSYAEFERSFGASNSLGELHDQIKQFFLNGGSTAWILRIADGATASEVTLDNEAGSPTLKLVARSAGTVGNYLRATVDYKTASPESTFNLSLARIGPDTGGNIVDLESETFKNLSMNPNDGNYVVTVLDQQSTLATAEFVGGAPVDPVAGLSMWGFMEDGATLTKLKVNMGGAASVGKFNVAVDGGPFVTVTLNHDDLTTVGDVESAINAALSPLGKSVTVTQEDMGGAASAYAYTITSGTGGRVTCSPATTNDIAVVMQMGVAQGGLEVDGYALRRPAPNGLFASLSSDSFSEFRDTTFGKWATTAKNAWGTISIDGTALATVNSLWSGQAYTALEDGGADKTLLNARASLIELINSINADSSEWSAELQGLRVVANTSVGGDAGDVTAQITSTLPAANEIETNLFDSTTNVTRYELGNGDYGDYQDGTNGSNGTSPTTSIYTDSAFDIAAREIDLFNIVVLPKDSEQSDADRAELWGPASVFAKTNRAVLIVDPPGSWSSVSDVTDNIANLRIGIATDHATLYWPRISISSGGGTKTVDPSGALAGIMARTDANRGVWKAPAGLEANLLGVRGVQHSMSDAENGSINPEAVNAIRAFPNGVVSWGARTMVGFDNSGNDDYKYLPVRRLALYIEESLYRGLKWAVFEPNDAPLWRQLQQSAGAFMNNLFRLGAFAGSKKSDAYFVKVDGETTTQNDINLGVVNVVVGFAPLKPAEFVVITLQQQAGEVQT